MSEPTREQDEQQTVTREATLPVEEERAWEAITDPDRLSEWLAEEVELEPEEGAPARFVVDGTERLGVVREVEEGSRISFSWRAPEEPATLVELTLTPLEEGRAVRLTVVETAFTGTGLPIAAAPGWTGRLQASAAGGALAGSAA